MPPKTFTCAVCGEQVTKPKSYALADNSGNRACRIHEEAQVAKEERHQKEIERREFEQQKAAIQKNKQDCARNPMALRCACCLVEGLSQQEFYQRKLIANEIADIQNGRPVLPWEKESFVKGVSPEKPLLVTIEIPKNKEHRIQPSLRMILEFTGRHLPLCQKCINDIGLVQPELDAQKLLLGAVAYEAIKPDLQNLANDILEEGIANSIASMEASVALNLLELLSKAEDEEEDLQDNFGFQIDGDYTQ